MDDKATTRNARRRRGEAMARESRKQYMKATRGVMCELCGDSVRRHALYGCCGAPNGSTASCGNGRFDDARGRCYECQLSGRHGVTSLTDSTVTL